MTITYEGGSASTDPTITANPTSVSGMEAVVGGTPTTATVAVTGTNLTGNIAAAIVEENSPFSVSPASIAQTDGSANGSVTITYTPTAAGTHTGTLRLTSTDATTVDVPLSGTATLPPTPTITVNPATVTINTEPYTAGSANFTVSGANLTGDINLSVSGTGFSVIPNTITAADAANGVTVTVTYSAQEAGTFSGTVTLTSDGAEDKTVTINASVVVPVISGTVTPASLNFSCQEGQTNTATITVENTGNVAFTPAFSGIAAPFSIEAATEIAAGASKQFTVTYAPTAAGTHTGTLTVTINGTATNVALNGTATEAPQTGELAVPAEVTIGNKYLTNISPIYGTGQLPTVGKYVQTIYPASLLADLNGKQITQIKFRAGNLQSVAGKVQFSIGETDVTNTDYSSKVDESTLKNVAEVAFNATGVIDNGYLVVNFNSPYVYNGGNIVILTKTTQAYSGAENFKFYGSSTYDLGLGNVTVVNTNTNPPSSSGNTYTNQYNKSFLPQATFTYEKVAGVEVSPEDGALAFGEVSTTGSKTLNVTVLNKNSVAASVSVSTLQAPFSTTYSETEIPASTTATIPVKFAPTEGISYSGTFTVTVNGVDYQFTLTGSGRVNEPTMTDEDFAAITYDWTDSENVEHKNTPMNEIATTPEQMVALMKAVYTNKNVPGNIYRGFTAEGVREADMVSYPAIGSVSNGAYADSYGWDIKTSKSLVDVNGTSYLDPTEYIPNKEGLTVLLVEMNDQDVAQAKAAAYGFGTTISGGSDYQSTSGYTDLVRKFDVMFKSVRVLTSSKNMGGGEDAGTLFKIDCDKMNRFFLLAKGHLRTPNSVPNTYYSDGKSYQVVKNSSIHMGPFYEMFEQFSPNVAEATSSAQTDIYQKLVDMENYTVIHDCVSIPSVGGNHEFNLYGVDSESDDCQDVRDLMFFIPERRMTYWHHSSALDDYRDPRDHDNETGAIINTDEKYVNYNQDYPPKVGLFVIKQFPIEGEKQDNANVYDLNLSWTSNLLNFLPGEDGVYKLYRVVTNADGTKTYQLIAGNLDPNTFSYVDHIEMQQTGQVVTYVVQGQDKEEFLSLQMSNEESFVIPGLDRKEQLRIALNSDYYFSRYDAATKTNNYSNSLIANNTVGTNVKPEYLAVWQEGSDVGLFKFWRATLKTVDGQQVVDKDNAVNFASCKVTSFNATTGGTLAYVEGDDQTDFSGEKYGRGYHASEATSTISIVDGEVVFDGLKLYDNFRVSVEENYHPAQYVYYVTLKTAVPFALNDEGTETSQDATSNTVSVPVYKTGMTMTPLTAQQVENDVDHSAPAGTTFDLNARYSSKSEILGYYIYRWADTETAASARSIYANNGDDASPQGQAGNQGTYYTVAMNSDFTSRTENFGSDFADVTASFQDNYVFDQAEKGDTYTYAPVVELFAPQQAVELPSGDDREDYNTYGGPQQMSAGGVITIIPGTPKANESTFVAEAYDTDVYTTAPKCKYYYIPLTINVDLPNENEYEIYKVRAWRQIDTQWLGEMQAQSGRVSNDYLYDTIDEGANEDADVLIGTTSSDGNANHFKGLFGAKALSSGESFDVNFIVRVYFTKKNASKAGAEYYIAEKQQTVTITDQVITGIVNVKGEKQVAGVKYYNVAGMESDKPFSGVNIVVTRYTDGSTSTSKVLK